MSESSFHFASGVRAKCLLLLAEPLFPEYPRRRTESLEHIQRVPDRVHEPLFERCHEDAIRDPVGGIGGRFAIRDRLKLLHDRPGFEEEFADFLEEENGSIRLARSFLSPLLLATMTFRFVPDRMAWALS